MAASVSSGWDNASSISGDSILTGDNDDNRDSTLQKKSFSERAEGGLFSVLYVFNTSKSGAGSKMVVTMIVLEFLQLMAMVYDEQFPWSESVQKPVYDVLKIFLLHRYLIDQGYNIFRGFVFFLFVMNVSIIAFGAYITWLQTARGRRSKEPNKYALSIISQCLSIFFATLYMANLQTSLAALDCRVNEDSLKVFPNVKCLSGDHSGTLALSALNGVTTVIIGFCVVLSRFQTSPASSYLLAGISPQLSLVIFTLKSFLAIVTRLLYAWQWFQGVLMVAFSAYIAFFAVRFVPYYATWMNILQGGLYTAMAWSFFCLGLAIVYPPSQGLGLTLAVVIGLVPMGLLGAFLARRRMKELKGSSMIEKDETGQWVMAENAEFASPQQVELATRFVRDSKDDREAVTTGDAIFQIGMREFSQSAFLHIAYANFCNAWDSHTENVTSYWDRAAQLGPNFFERYMLFAREKQKKLQRKQNSGGGESMDLAAYVEFQGAFQDALRFHESALRSLRNVWRLLMQDEPTVGELMKVFESAEQGERKANEIFRMMFERFPKTVKLLRAYARFCEEVTNNPRLAKKFNGEAEKLEHMLLDAQDTAGTGDEVNIATRVDDKTDAVVVINEQGIIQTANRIASKMFGYKKGELPGRNVRILMPQPYSSQHDTYLRTYMKTQKATILGVTQELEGKHKDGYTFPVALSVNRIDSAKGVSFMGVIKVREDKTAKLSINKTGIVLSVNQQFEEMFGWTAQDVVGRNVKKIMPERFASKHDGYLAKYNDESSSRGLVDTAGRQLFGLRKDGSEFQIKLELEQSGNGKDRTFSAKITSMGEMTGTLTIDHTGVIVSCNKQVAEMFGFGSDSNKLVQKNVTDLMPPMYRDNHGSFLQRRASGGEPHIGDEGRVLEALHQDGTIFLIHLSVNEIHEEGQGVQFAGKIVTANQTHIADDERTASITIDPKGVILDCNQRACELSGYDAAELIGENIKMIQPDEVAEKHDGYLAAYAKTGKAKVIGQPAREVQLLQKDGKMITNLLFVKKTTYDGEPAFEGHMFCLESKGVVDLSNDGVIMIDPRGIIQSMDKNALTLFGYSNDKETVKKNVNILMPPPYNKQHDGYLQRYSESGKANILGERQHLEGMRSNGSKFPLDLLVTREEVGGRVLFKGMVRKLQEQDATIQINKLGKIVAANDAFEEMFGYTTDELMDQNIKMIMPQRYALKHDEYIKQFYKRIVRKSGNKDFKNVKGKMLRGQHKNGREFNISLDLTLKGTGSAAIVIGKIKDVSKMKGKITISSSNGMILAVSKEMAMLFGYENEADMVGKNVNMLVPEKWRADHTSFLHRRVQTGQKRIGPEGRVVEGLHKDGTIILVKLGIEEMPPDKDGTVLFGGTAQLAGVQELQADRNVAKISIDTQGTIQKCNSAISAILGYSDKELVGQNIKIITPDDVSPHHDGFLAKYRETGKSTLIGQPPRELPARHKDGRTIPVSLMLTNDIKKGEEIVTGLMYQLHSQPIIDPATDGMIVINHTGKIVSANDNIHKWWGYDREAGELVGHNVRRIMPSPFSKQHDMYLRNYRQSGRAHILGQWQKLEGRHKTGTRIPIELLVTKSGDGEKIRFSGLIRLRADDVPTITIDKKGTIQAISEPALSLFQYSKQEVIGNNVKMLMPERIAVHHDGYLSKFNSEVDSKKRCIIDAKGRQLHARKKSGLEFMISLDLQQDGEGDKKTVTARIKDLGNTFGMVTINEYGIIRNCNDECALLFGYQERSDLVGENVTILMPKHLHSVHGSYIAHRANTGQVKIGAEGRVVEGQHKDGSKVLVHLSVSDVKGRDGSSSVGSDSESSGGAASDFGSSVDDTDERQFAARIRVADRGTVEKDGQASVVIIDTEGTIMSVNENFLQLAGTDDEEEVVGQNIRRHVIDEHARKHDAYIQRYLKTRQTRIVSQPGRVVPFTKLDGSTQDIFIFVDETEFNGTFGFKGILFPLFTPKSSQEPEAHEPAAPAQYNSGAAQQSVKPAALSVDTKQPSFLRPADDETPSISQSPAVDAKPRKRGVMFSRDVEAVDTEGAIASVKMNKQGGVDLKDINQEEPLEPPEIETDGDDYAAYPSQIKADRVSAWNNAEQPSAAQMQQLQQSFGKKFVSDSSDDGMLAPGGSDNGSQEENDEDQITQVKATPVERRKASSSMISVFKNCKQYRKATHLAEARARLSMAAVIASFIVFFGVGRYEDQLMSDCISGIKMTSDMCTIAEEFSVDARDMYLAHKAGSSSAYSTSKATLREHVDQVENLMKQTFFGPGYCKPSSEPALDNFLNDKSRTVVEIDDTAAGIATGSTYIQTYSMWEFAGHLVRHARLTPESITLVPSGTNLTSNKDWRFLIDNSETWSSLCESVLKLRADQARHSQEFLTYINWGGFGAQAAVFCIVMFGVLRPLDNAGIDARVALFASFLSVPKPYVYAYSRERVEVKDEENEDGDSEEEEENEKANAEGEEADAETPKKRSTPRLSQGVPRLGSGSNLVNKQQTNQEDKVEKSRGIFKSRTQSSFNSSFLERSGSVGIVKTALAEKSTLKFIHRFRWPLGIWGILLVLSAIEAQEVTHMAFEPIADLRHFSLASLYIVRIRLYAQELYTHALENISSSSIEKARKVIQADTGRLRMEYENVLYGNASEHLSGAVSRNSKFKSLLFEPSCFRTTNCLTESDTFYDAANRGLDTLVLHYIQSANSLSNQGISEITVSSNKEFFAVDSLGHDDLYPGVAQALDEFKNEASTWPALNSGLQGALLAVLLALCFYLSSRVVEPYFGRIAGHIRMAVNLLSRLPGPLSFSQTVVIILCDLDQDNKQLLTAGAI